MTDENQAPQRASKALLALVFSPILLIGGCTAMLVFPWKAFAPPASSPAPNKYAQTWTKEYKVTTCGDWSYKMSEGQRWAAAADILTAARNKISGGSGMPADSLVTLFEANITEACEGSSEVTIAEVSYVVYNYDSTFKP